MEPSLAAEFLELVSPHLKTEASRRNLVQRCCGAIAPKLDFSGSIDDFSGALLDELETYGEVTPTEPATVAFLKQIRENVGVDVQGKIDSLIYAIYSSRMGINQTPPPRSEDIREQWMLDTLWDVNTALASLNERVLQLFSAVDSYEAIRDRTEKNRRGVIFNRILISIIIIIEIATLAFVLSGARIV